MRESVSTTLTQVTPGYMMTYFWSSKGLGYGITLNQALYISRIHKRAVLAGLYEAGPGYCQGRPPKSNLCRSNLQDAKKPGGGQVT
jgi:hypothetical protein